MRNVNSVQGCGWLEKPELAAKAKVLLRPIISLVLGRCPSWGHECVCSPLNTFSRCPKRNAACVKLLCGVVQRSFFTCSSAVQRNSAWSHWVCTDLSQLRAVTVGYNDQVTPVQGSVCYPCLSSALNARVSFHPERCWTFFARLTLWQT